MPSKIVRKYSLNITGTLNLDDGIVKIEVEDLPDPVILADVASDFDGKEVNLSLGFKEEI